MTHGEHKTVQWLATIGDMMASMRSRYFSADAGKRAEYAERSYKIEAEIQALQMFVRGVERDH